MPATTQALTLRERALAAHQERQARLDTEEEARAARARLHAQERLLEELQGRFGLDRGDITATGYEDNRPTARVGDLQFVLAPVMMTPGARPEWSPYPRLLHDCPVCSYSHASIALHDLADLGRELANPTGNCSECLPF
jgi:hypothetical protein